MAGFFDGIGNFIGLLLNAGQQQNTNKQNPARDAFNVGPSPARNIGNIRSSVVPQPTSSGQEVFQQKPASFSSGVNSLVTTAGRGNPIGALGTLSDLGNAYASINAMNQWTADNEADKSLLASIPEDDPQYNEVLNRMQERITTFIQDRTRILAAISHDLKTPLTSIVLRAEMLPDCEDKNKLIDTVSNMSKMVRATLDFARSEENREECRELRLSSLVESIASDYQDNGHDVSFTEESAFKNANTFLCRPTEMHRILQNLIDNSLCYGTQVKVRLQENSDAIRLMVEDNGPGIPEDQQENVFKPFMRLDKARATDDAHVGLGLSIVRNLVLKQGGSIDIENIKPHGLRIAITYPLN